MKRFALYSVPLVGALAFAAACTDATSPGDPHSSLRPGTPTTAISGNLPPPPTRTAVDISASTTGAAAPLAATLAAPCPSVSGAFDGTYFANGKAIESGVASAEIGDAALAFEGTAWLRIDNKQNTAFGTAASANARFQVTDQKTSGKGTLTFFNGLCVLVITDVVSFIPNPQCTVAGEPCAQIVFTATLNGQPATGTATAFDREFCTTFTDEGGNTQYFCPPEGGGS